ncbi:hypothetical protein [Candidatus Nitrosotenuis uzonensis]|uniref:Uncharacterized protein n=1 Tax=Candidatus Nitrosotenuis uzonensis TaxID=1407055 RepID=A0A812EYH6_9ARCH|nr:hypothetical protein [Candidatus Nitrosotenuis uzonensis]CAE6486519.1 hypothetical protein NUZ5A_20154 [Candidatus Nitrosotenuis uzonensis]
MRENNANTTANLGEENESINLSKTMTSNSKNYKESCNIEKISEQKNTGLPTHTGEPASGYFSQVGSPGRSLNTKKAFGVVKTESRSKQGKQKYGDLNEQIYKFNRRINTILTGLESCNGFSPGLTIL